MSSFYSDEELKAIGFKEIGKNVIISKKASIYNPEKMVFGNDVRVDDFCILSGDIRAGNFVHISAGVYLYGSSNSIYLGDFCGLSAGCVVYSGTDDFSGNHLVGSMVDAKYRRIISGPVIFENYVQIGAGSVILPGVRIGEGTSVGSMTLINKDLEAWKIYTGIPAKILKERQKQIVSLAEKMLNERSKRIDKEI